MNKKILSGILCGALIVASASTFVSCKDYDDDISGVQKQVDANKDAADEQYKTLTALVEANMNKVQGQIETINGKIDDVDEAYKAADAELKAAIEAEKAALEALTSTAGTADASAQEVAIKLAAVATELREKAEANAADIAAVKTNLEDAKSELQASIDANKASVDESIKTINETIAALKAASSTGAAQEDIDALEKKLTDEITTLTAKDVELEKAISAAQADIAQAQSDIKDLNARLTSVETYTQELQGTTIPALQKDIENLKTDLAKMSSLGTSDAAVATVSKAVDALATRVSANEEAIAKIKERVAGIEAAVTGLKNDFAAYQLLVSADFAQVWASIDSLKARVAATEGRLDVLEPALEAEADARKAVNGKVDTEIADRQAACAELNGRVDSLNAALATQLSALNLKLNAEITNRRNADTKLNDSIDVVAANLQKSVNNLQHQIDEIVEDRLPALEGRVGNLETDLGTLNKNFNNLKKDLSHLITSIVYQGDGAQGSYTTTPTAYGNQPVIWYKKLTSDFAAWPFDSIKGSIKETAAGKTVSYYKSGHIYATLNPSTVDLTGIELTLENSMGELNKYVKLSNVTLAEDVVLTRGTKNAGFYCMRVLPTADFDSAAFVDDVDLYAIAAHDELTDGSSRKVTSSYGINTEFETWTKLAPSVVAPEWKAVDVNGVDVAANYTGGFGSDFEFVGDNVNSIPGGFIKLNCDTTKIYKWYVEFFKDDNYSQNAKYDPTKIFANYSDNVQYGFAPLKAVALTDVTLLNKLVYVKVTAVGYDYTISSATHTISFTRPLIANKNIAQTVTPGDDDDSNDDPTLGIFHTTCDFSASFDAQFNTAEKALYAQTFSPSWSASNYAPTGFVFTTPQAVVYDYTENTFSLKTKYNPYYVALGANNTYTLTCKDPYGHPVVNVNATMTVNKPNHLDALIDASREMPAAFNFFTKVDDATEASKAQAALGDNYIIAWTATPGKADYNLNGAFKDLDRSGNTWFGLIKDDPTTVPGKGTVESPWTMSWGSRYAFTSSQSGIRFYNFDSKYVVKNADGTFNSLDAWNRYSAKLENLTDITVFGDVVNSDAYTHNGGKKGAFNYAGFKQFSASECVDYYAMNQTYHAFNNNLSVNDQLFFGDKKLDFKMTFVDPINYGFSEKNNTDVEFQCAVLPAYNLDYDCAGIVGKSQFFWTDYSTTEHNAFYLDDSRIKSVAIDYDHNNENAQFIKNWLTSGTYFTFDYTSTSYNQPIYIDAWMVVTDAWDVQSKITFKIKLVKTGI